MKKRTKLIEAVMASPWALDPEAHTYMLDFLYGKINRDLIMARDAKAETIAEKEGFFNMVDGTNIAYIPVYGTIYPRSSGMEEFCGKETTVTDIEAQFNRAIGSKDVKGIIMGYDTPGGVVTGIHGLHETIKAARGSKPIFSYTQGTSASAGYWLFSAADKTFADKTARVGSVGTIIGVRKNEPDSTYVEVTNSLSPYKRLNVEDEKHHAQLVKTLDDITDVFYSDLADAFSLEKDYVIENFGKGAVKVGESAQKSKMITQTASFYDVVSMMKDEIKQGRGKKIFSLGGIDTNAKTLVTDLTSEAKTGGIMNLVELKANYPELVAQIVGEVSATSSTDIAAIKGVVAEKEKEIAAAAETIADLQKKSADLEKANMQLVIKGAHSDASGIFAGLFAASSIPEKFKSKVEKQVSAADFIDEKGVLATEDYKKHVSAEIADWEGSFTAINQPVAGVGADNKGVADETPESKNKEVDDEIAALLAMV